MESMNVCYIKTSPYVAQYLRVEYGDPVVLPYNYKVQRIMDKYLVRNNESELMTPMCYSQALYDSRDVLAIDIDTTEYVALVLPDVLKVDGRKVVVDCLFQFDAYGAAQLRKELLSIFFNALEQYREDIIYTRTGKDRHRVPRDVLIDDFLRLHHISCVHSPTVLRQWSRARSHKASDGAKRLKDMQERCAKNFAAQASFLSR